MFADQPAGWKNYKIDIGKIAAKLRVGWLSWLPKFDYALPCGAVTPVPLDGFGRAREGDCILFAHGFLGSVYDFAHAAETSPISFTTALRKAAWLAAPGAANFLAKAALRATSAFSHFDMLAISLRDAALASALLAANAAAASTAAPTVATPGNGDGAPASTRG